MRGTSIALVLALAASVLLQPASSARAAVEPAAVAREVNMAAAAATAVIGTLQPRINGGTATATDLDPDALRRGFADAYRQLAGHPLDAPADPAIARIRAAMGEQMLEVVAEFRSDILRGGQDAFVPAFFRAQLLQRFNGVTQGVRAVVSMRSAELINRDSAIERLIEDRAIVAHINRMLEAGRRDPDITAFGQRTVGYWPMVIGEACAACHQRNGLNQQVGAFGGATIVIVGR